MGVPAHNLNDLEFAKIFAIDYSEVINHKNLLINSAEFNNFEVEKASKLIFEKLEKFRLAKKSISYKIKDWVFSRQRYWGEPFPVYFDQDGKIYLEEKIVELPHLEKIVPSGDGQSPLALQKDWVFLKKTAKSIAAKLTQCPNEPEVHGIILPIF